MSGQFKASGRALSEHTRQRVMRETVLSAGMHPTQAGDIVEAVVRETGNMVSGAASGEDGHALGLAARGADARA